jgi:hypothetical protein
VPSNFIYENIYACDYIIYRTLHCLNHFPTVCGISTVFTTWSFVPVPFSEPVGSIARVDTFFCRVVSQKCVVDMRSGACSKNETVSMCLLRTVRTDGMYS